MIIIIFITIIPVKVVVEYWSPEGLSSSRDGQDTAHAVLGSRMVKRTGRLFPNVKV